MDRSSSKLTTTYLGLGGNIGDTVAIFQQALTMIRQVRGVCDLEVSPFYRTTPVSDTPQDDYVNAVCRLKTSLSILQLMEQLQHIERSLGKVPKEKFAPRVLDLDILFFGKELHKHPDCEVPHPRWRDRLFVIAPLKDLTATIDIPNRHIPGGIETIDLSQMLKAFPNIHNETVSIIKEVEAR